MMSRSRHSFLHRVLDALPAKPAFGTGLLLALLGPCAVTLTAAQPANTQSPAAQEPITPIPPAPVVDPRRLALGEKLFHDPRLSHDGRRGCVFCHDVATNGASGRRTDLTPEGQGIALNTPTVFNAALSFRLNWEGNFRTLESQAEQSLLNPDIMATTPDEVVGKLRADPDAVRDFRGAYGRAPDRTALLDALATYERSLLTPGSRFDLWLGGQADAITAQELAGYQLFKTLGCVACHQGVNVGGNLYQRHGIFSPLASPNPEWLRVPSLRNIATTPPYFHDGSAATLPKTIRAMAVAQLDHPLTDGQTELIAAFLNTLTGIYRDHTVAPVGEPPP